MDLFVFELFGFVAGNRIEKIEKRLLCTLSRFLTIFLLVGKGFIRFRLYKVYLSEPILSKTMTQVSSFIL